MQNPMINKKSSLLNIKEQTKTVANEFVSSSNVSDLASVSIFDIVEKKQPKDEKVLMAINIKKEISDKVKSFAFENNMTVSELLEEVIVKMFDKVEVNYDALRSYEEKYKKKSTKKSRKKG